LAERNKNENLKCEHLKIPKPRFTDRCPDMSDTSFQKGTVTAFPRVDPWGEAPAKNPHWGGGGGVVFRQGLEAQEVHCWREYFENKR